MKNKTNFEHFKTAGNNHKINNLRHNWRPTNPKNKTNFPNLPAVQRCRSLDCRLWLPFIQQSKNPLPLSPFCHSVKKKHPHQSQFSSGAELPLRLTNFPTCWNASTTSHPLADRSICYGFNDPVAP